MLQRSIRKLQSLIDPAALDTGGMTTEILSDDVFLVSYPKSGNTWMRFLVGNYLTGCDLDFSNVDLTIPDIHFNPQRCADIKVKPRFVKSHESYTAAYPKVVYIVRDGRDVAVSYYYYMQKKRRITSTTSFSDFLQKFAKNGAGGFGNWSDHVKSWTRKADRNNILLIKYEDILLDAAKQLNKVMEFANIEDVNQDRITNAVHASLFEKMQKLEAKQQDSYFFTRYKTQNEAVQFLRKGKSENWHLHFSQEDEALFLKFNGKTLRSLGYV